MSACWAFPFVAWNFSFQNYSSSFLLGLISPSKKWGTYLYSTPMNILHIHYKVKNYDTWFYFKKLSTPKMAIIHMKL
jgi:hypothetical protein